MLPHVFQAYNLHQGSHYRLLLKFKDFPGLWCYISRTNGSYIMAQYLIITNSAIIVIGTDTVLKLGAQTFAPEIFLACPPPQFALCPPIPGAQWGHTTMEQEAQLMLTTGSTRLAVSRGQQTWYHSTCSFLLCNSNFVFKTRRFYGIRLQKISWTWNGVKGHSSHWEWYHSIDCVWFPISVL